LTQDHPLWTLFPDKVSLTHSRSLSLSHSLSLFLSALIGSWYWFLAFCDRFLAYVTAYNCRAHGLTLCPESCPERALLGHTSQKRALKEPCWDARLLNKLSLSLSLSLSLTHTHTHCRDLALPCLIGAARERQTVRERDGFADKLCTPNTLCVSLCLSLSLSRQRSFDPPRGGSGAVRQGEEYVCVPRTLVPRTLVPRTIAYLGICTWIWKKPASCPSNPFTVAHTQFLGLAALFCFKNPSMDPKSRWF